MDDVVLANNNQIQQTDNAELSVTGIAEGLLLDTKDYLATKQVITMPITELATLGTTGLELLPKFRTITSTTTLHTDNLFRLANAEVGDVLKTAKNGDNWGAIKTAEGKSKMARFQSVNGVSATTKTVKPLHPAIIAAMVALYSIDQKMDEILDIGKQILAFREIDREAKIEGYMAGLISLLGKFKYNREDEQFIINGRKQMMEYQQNTREMMIAYQKEVHLIVNSKNLLVSQSKVKEILDKLLRNFKYYRLSLYTFSMASFAEVILSGNFKEDNLLNVIGEIESISLAYRELFNQCSAYLQKLSDAAIGTTITKGIGAAGKTAGKFVGNIPLINKGSVDEFLQDKGARLKDSADNIEKMAAQAFAEIANPNTGIFIEKMRDLIQIYNHTQEICFDDKFIYLVGE